MLKYILWDFVKRFNKVAFEFKQRSEYNYFAGVCSQWILSVSQENKTDCESCDIAFNGFGHNLEQRRAIFFVNFSICKLIS